MSHFFKTQFAQEATLFDLEDTCMETIKITFVTGLVVALATTFSLFSGLVNAQGRADTTKPATDLSSLTWLAGAWTGVQGKVEMEEHWLAPKGNMMLGLHRDIVGERTVMFEYLRIEATLDAITYWASPKGRPATPFRLKESRENHVVFENPEHDFPQRIIYWLDKDGSLHARIEGLQGGKAASEEWTWKKQ